MKSIDPEGWNRGGEQKYATEVKPLKSALFVFERKRRARISKK